MREWLGNALSKLFGPLLKRWFPEGLGDNAEESLTRPTICPHCGAKDEEFCRKLAQGESDCPAWDVYER